MYRSVVIFSFSVACVLGHVYLENPPARGSAGYSDQSLYPVDYNLARPLYFENDGPAVPFPCGGRTQQGPVQATYKAGETVNVKLADRNTLFPQVPIDVYM